MAAVSDKDGMSIFVDDLRAGYVEVIRYVLECGSDAAPRGLRTKELLGTTIILSNPDDALPTGVGRGVNLKIAAAEAIQLVGAFSSPELLLHTGGQFNTFLEPDGTFWGAYGNRIGIQLIRVWEKLCDDPDTRQAVITLWNPLLDNERGHPDYPCTLSLHFMIRDGRLDLHVTMRSNDVWWGLAYDAFQFTQLQLTLAGSLGIAAGRYFHHANSLHMYERDWHRADGLREPIDTHASVRGIGQTGERIAEAIHRARLLGQGRLHRGYRTLHEDWYAKNLPVDRFVP